MQMVHSQVGLTGSGPTVLCQPLTVGIQPEAPVGVRFRETLTTRSGRTGMGARGGCRTGTDSPKCDVHKDSGELRLMRLCGASARTALPRAAPGKRQELRFARLAGRKDGRAGYPTSRPRHTQLDRSVLPYAPTPSRPASGGRSSLQALPVIRSSRQKESGGWGGETRPVVWCVWVGGSGLPCQAGPPARRGVPTSIHFCASEKAGSRAARAAGAGELPDRERDKPFAKPRVHSSAGPPG